MTKLIERLNVLQALVDETGCEEVLVASGWTDFAHELEMAYPLFRSVIETATEISKMYTEEALGLHYPGDTWEEVKSDLAVGVAALKAVWVEE